MTGSPYHDTVAIQVINDHEIKETDKKKGQVVAASTRTVSSDGKALVLEFSDGGTTNGGLPVTGSGTEMRVAKGPAGSHAISGSWRMSSQNLSNNATTAPTAMPGSMNQQISGHDLEHCNGELRQVLIRKQLSIAPQKTGQVWRWINLYKSWRCIRAATKAGSAAHGDLRHRSRSVLVGG